MYRYKLTAGWLRQINTSADFMDPDISEIHTIKPLSAMRSGSMELVGNMLITTRCAEDCVIDVRPGVTGNGLYVPHGGHVVVRSQMRDSDDVLSWSTIPFKRVPIVRGYIVRIEPDKITCSVQKRDGTYTFRQFTSRRALDRAGMDHVVPYWMWGWASAQGMREWARNKLAEGFEVDAHGVPVIEHSTDDPSEDKWSNSRLLENMSMPLTLPFRCAAPDELVYTGVKLWDNQDYRDWLKGHPEVRQKFNYSYDEHSDRKILVYIYKIQEVSEERIQKALQFNDVYWTDKPDDDESEQDETEEQETGETNE